MLPIFPGPFFDELFSSRVCRAHYLRGHKSHIETFRELFDSPPFVLSLWIPAHLDTLINKLPGNKYETMKDILDKNTLFPLFQTFCGSRITEPSTPDSDDYKLTGVPRRIVGGAGTTYLCPKCVEEDFSTVGTPFIHRSHQIPGVLVCWKHGNLLLDRCSYCGCPFERKRDLLTVPWQRCICNHSAHLMSANEDLPEKDIAVSFSIFSHELLQTADKVLNAKCLVQTYRKQLIKLGFNRKSAIARTEVIDAIVNFYGKSLLARMDSAYRTGRTSSWLNHIMEASTFDVPLNRHLINAFFLFKKADLFWKNVELEIKNIDDIEKDNLNKKHTNKSKISNKVQKKRTRNTFKSDNQKSNVIMNELENIRKEHPEYKFNDFWSFHFGHMKRLVVASQDEFQKFRESLDSDEIFLSEESNSRFKKREEKYHQMDNVSAGEIERIAILFYASNGKPIKVTRNAILKEAKLVNRINTKPNDFPLSIQKLNKYVESEWHFYARRIIWAKLKFGKRATAPSHIIQPPGVNHYRGLALTDYFHNVKATQKLRKGTIIGILIESGISRDWKGPCPDRQFVTYGRAYIKKSKIESSNRIKRNAEKENVKISDKNKKIQFANSKRVSGVN